MPKVPCVLTIAGSDPSGGAGLQADLKTLSAFGVYGCAVATALTAQNTTGVSGVHVVPAAFVGQQLDAVLADIDIAAVKLGMLGSAAVMDAVAERLRPWRLTGSPSEERARLTGSPSEERARLTGSPSEERSDESRWLVLDPVMVSTSGAVLMARDALDALWRLVRLADVVTPNLAEAAALLGATRQASDRTQMLSQAAQLCERGARAVLLKGGHLDEDAADLWFDTAGPRWFTARRIDSVHTHGTGCTLSSALAAARCTSPDWETALGRAKDYVTRAIVAGADLGIGGGRGPLWHGVSAGDLLGARE